jgi:hypothetical protein
VKIIKLNIVYLIKYAKDAEGVLFGIASIILLFIEKEDLKIDSVGNGILILTSILWLAIIIAVSVYQYISALKLLRRKYILAP